MRYFDTSFLVPLILDEATSARIEGFVTKLPAGELAISHLTRVEFSSLLAREVRMGKLDPSSARRADVQFETMMQETFVVFLPNADDFDLAKEYLGRPDLGLRAADALHLAIAKNRRCESVYTLDKTLLSAGRLFGTPMNTGFAIGRHTR